MTADDPFECVRHGCRGGSHLMDKETDESRAENASTAIFMLYCGTCHTFQNHWRDGKGEEQFIEMSKRESADV